MAWVSYYQVSDNRRQRTAGRGHGKGWRAEGRKWEGGRFLPRLYKRLSEATPPFDLRHSSFYVVSYKRCRWPKKRPVKSRKKLMNIEHRTSNECILSILKKISRSLRLVGVLTPTPRRATPSFRIPSGA